MKKLLAALLTLMLLSLSWTAFGEGTAFSLEQLEGIDFLFSSGVGAWYTLVNIHEDGTLTGQYHDSDMGDAALAYPNGTVYGCTFHGRLSVRETGRDQVLLTLEELALDEGQLPEAIEGGVRYITAAPYGLDNAANLVLFLPGAETASLPGGFLDWAHLYTEDGQLPEKLDCYGLYNPEDECGFVGYPPEDAQPAPFDGVPFTVTARSFDRTAGASSEVTEEYHVMPGEVLAVGGLSQLNITINDARPGAVTFTTDRAMRSLSSGEAEYVFTVENGASVTMLDPGQCDGSSSYTFQAPALP